MQMVSNIHIKNFKSIVDLQFDLGSFNVLIGENGCGKSNILEAIAFGAAASANKLDFEFLGSRGIRTTNPEFMYSAFNSQIEKKIALEFKLDDNLFDNLNFELSNDKKNPKKWINISREIFGKEIGDTLANLMFKKNISSKRRVLSKFLENDQNLLESLEKITKEINLIAKKNNKLDKNKDFFKFIFNQHFLADRFSNEIISNYIVYSPEQSSLRKFEETTQIYPLGVRGEGLFQFLKEITSNKKNKKKIEAIKDSISFLDWYDGFEIPDNLLQNEFSLNVKDKYLSSNIEYFDQRSTNEGFLYILFYATLFISEETPKFFAIDNIDNSFNPKLCVQIIKTLASLAKKHKKQVIVTTQNPAVLDGLNLKDNGQRLFVVSRNSKGHTRTERINYNSDRTMKLSEVWSKGFIGGLPSNF